MYSAIVLLGVLFAVSAEHYGVIPPHRYTGKLAYAADETPKPYQFAYQAEAIGGVSTRQETADGSGTVAGSYTLSDDDGRKRVVDYVADESGFRASVKTNEPGTKNESPADVPTVSEAADKPVGHFAPLTYSSAYRSPYHYGAYGSLGYKGAYGSLGYGSYPYGAYGRNYGRGLGYYGGHGSPNYGEVSGYGNRYALGYGSRNYGGALGYGGHYHGRPYGYGNHYYGSGLGAHGQLGYGGYRGYGHGGYHPYSYGHGLGYRYGKSH